MMRMIPLRGRSHTLLFPFFRSLLALLLTAGGLHAQTSLYVDSSINASGAGSSWSAAYKTLNEALNTANTGSVAAGYRIFVAKGTYYPTGSAAGANRDSAFVLARGGIRMYGGYPSGGGTRNTAANPTILSGNIGNPALTSDNSCHVMVVTDIDSAADTVMVDGLSIIAGNGDNINTHKYYTYTTYGNWGGGVFFGAVGPVVFNDCSFTNNYAYFGGAMYVLAPQTVLTNCRFTGNTSGRGGGIYIWRGGATIKGCTFTGNSVPQLYGGAIEVYYGSLQLSTSAFTGNTAPAGAAIAISRYSGGWGPVSIDNCSFTSNVATGSANYNGGGAIYDQSTSVPPAHIGNCAFSGNVSTYSGGALYQSYSSGAAFPPPLKGCTFTHNTAGQHGGAVYLSANGSSTQGNSLKDYVADSCAFSGNKASGNGGGIYVVSGSGASLGATRCLFNADTAMRGGGACGIGTGSFTACRFIYNYALAGGGLYLQGAETSDNSLDTFSGNVATQRGGALFNHATAMNTSFRNSLFSGNKAGVAGGAVTDSSSATWSLQFVNCTLAGDTALSGNGLFCDAASPAFYNCIIREGAANGIAATNGGNVSADYSDVQGGYAGNWNIAADPLFVNPQSAAAAPTIAGDYRLMPCSPAINAGNNIVVTDPTDLAGAPRFYSSTIVDMGAYEYQGFFPAAIAGDSSLCMNSSLQLTNSLPGGLWSSSNPAIAAVSATGRITGMSTGKVTITYSIATGPCPMSVQQFVYVTSAPTATVTQSGLTLTAAQAGATYQWLDCSAGKAPIAGATGQSYTGVAGGQYALAVSLGGCNDTTSCMILSTTGVSPVEVSEGLHIYPNPARGEVTVTYSWDGADYLSIKDMTGKTMQQIMMPEPRLKLNLSGYPAGIYLIELRKAGSRIIKRINVL